MTTCVVSWCDRTPVARGLCDRCYRRAQLGIDPDMPPQVQATAETWERIRAEATSRRRAGETIRDIAASLGVSHDALSKRFREWGVAPDPEMLIPHGRPSAWMNHKCRCDVCVTARRAYKRDERLKRLAKPVTAEHGTLLAYKQGCDCVECRLPMRLYLRARNDKTRDGATRHRQAWTGADAEVAYTRTGLTIAERAALLGRTYAAVDNFIRAYDRRPDDPHGIKR